jgi:molecular chaperone DnaK
MAHAVGIDFGTSSCVIATIQAGRPVIIPNAEGEDTTPCVVHVTSDGARLAGTPAQPWAVRALQTTLSRVKSLLGKRYDEVRDEERRQFPELVRGPHDTVRVRLHETLYAPEELAAVILGKLMDDASQFLRERISTAVISVPASFTYAQRQALWDAGRIAGIRDLELMNEPTAAALAYGFA